MRILYVGKHGSGGNDDEGAITYALQQLGHTVITMREEEASRVPPVTAKADLALCHGWHDVLSFSKLPMVKAFWYFDRVDDPDPSLVNRNRTRINWVRLMTDACDIGFLTDGDWVHDHPNKRLRWLTQGADERVAFRGQASEGPPILVTASVQNGGTRRQQWITDLKERWGTRVQVVHRGYHGSRMANLIASAKVVIAPQHPSSHRYWSNRVYNALGFAALLLHPQCHQLDHHYPNLMVYSGDADLDTAINEALDSTAEQRFQISEYHYQHTLKYHLYRHRCQQLLDQVKSLS